MKVLIFNVYGSDSGTSEMKKIMKKSNFPRNRTGEIIDFVLNKAEVRKNDTEFSEIKKYLKENTNSIVCIGDCYLYWNESLKWTSKFVIREVDTSRPWCITEYDGAESIKYLDYKVIDNDINYCKYKGE